VRARHLDADELLIAVGLSPTLLQSRMRAFPPNTMENYGASSP